jgi:RNA polymerase sigma factor (sigma-70 family)
MERVFQTYMPLVRIVVKHGFGGFRGFRNPADQDDAAQQVFCAAFEENARLRYDGLQPYTGYLRGMAHNIVRQILSKDQRFQRTDGAPIPEDPLARDLEACVLDRETEALVRRFRESVTDTVDQAVLTGYFIDGKAEEALAAELRLTRYRVRKTIAALHKRMTRYMRENDVLPS